MSYPYFAASLPMLSFGAPPPFTAAEFEASARTALSAKDFAAVRAVCGTEDCAHPWVRRHRRDETQIRNCVARERAARLGGGVDAERFMRPHAGWSCEIERAVQDAFREPDPAARHRALARLRWNLADDAAGFDFSAIGAILAFRVKLGVLEDLAKADREKGAARLRAAANG